MTRAAVLFDMDGTLLRLDVDIEEVRLRLAELFAPYGVTAPFRPILRRIPAAAREAAAAGGDPAALERQGFAVLDRHELVGAREARPRPGAAEVVAALGARGVRLGLVTDNGRACVPAALAAAGLPRDAFAAVATRDDVPSAKPDPAGVLSVLEALGPVDVAWYVGDHPKDVEAGRAARARAPGLRVAGLAGGYASAEDLRRAGADVLLEELGGVLTLPGLALG